MASIFLSHNHADKAIVRRITQDLTRKGVRVWLDEAEINVGDSLIGKVETAISEMNYLGVILSPASVSSEWVQREVRQALQIEFQSKKVKVLPLVVEQCDVPGFLRDKYFADFRKDYESGLGTLMRRLEPWDALTPGTVPEVQNTWTPKAIRIGLEYTALETDQSSVRLSSAFIASLHDISRIEIEGPCEVFQKDSYHLLTLKSALHVHPGGPHKPLIKDDLLYFVGEAHTKVIDYCLRHAASFGIIHESSAGYTLDPTFKEEFRAQALGRLDLPHQPISLKFFIHVLLDLCRFHTFSKGKGDQQEIHLLAVTAFWVICQSLDIHALLS